jgi:hypothetical protein
MRKKHNLKKNHKRVSLYVMEISLDLHIKL